MSTAVSVGQVWKENACGTVWTITGPAGAPNFWCMVNQKGSKDCAGDGFFQHKCTLLSQPLAAVQTKTLPKVGEYVDLLSSLSSSGGKFRVKQVNEAEDMVELDYQGGTLSVPLEQHGTGWELSPVQPGQVWRTKSSDIRVLDWEAGKDWWKIEYLDSNGSPVLSDSIYESTLVNFCNLVTWNTPAAPKEDRFPHSCTDCGSKAYVGFKNVECSNSRCRHYV